MKLLLTSGGLTNETVISALKDLAGKSFGELNLAFVPTAANLEEGDKWWLIEDLDTCKRLKFKSVDIVDISALPRIVWQKRLEESDLLLFGGGNVYHLMYWINKSGLRDVLRDLLKSRVYVGISAGTIVATPSLKLIGDEKEPVKEIGETIYEDGLGLVNFLIEPHINNIYFPQLTFDYVEEESKQVACQIYALDDNSAIKVDDGAVQVVSEGEWEKFN